MGSGCCSGGSAEGRWFAAAHHGNATELKNLAERGFGVDERDLMGWTALKWAAKYGHGDCVLLLAELDADLEGAESPTPVMLAALEGHEACLRTLASRRAQLDARDRFGRTAAMLAAQTGYSECLKTLSAYDADLNIKDSDGQSVAMAYLVSTGDLLRLDARYPSSPCSMVQRSLEETWSSLPSMAPPRWHASARSGDLRWLRIVHEKGRFCVDARDDDARTASALAAEAGHEDCLQFLLDVGANPRKRLKGGRTLAMTAAMDGHYSCLRVLLQYHADAGAEDDAGRTATMLACIGGHDACAQLLLKQECGRAMLNAKDKTGSTAASVAAHYGHEGCLRLLIDMRADLESRDREGKTAATAAAASAHFTPNAHGNCLQLLAERGADFLAERRTDGLNALQIYELRNGFDVVAALLPAMDWRAAARKGKDMLLQAINAAFKNNGVYDRNCASSLNLALWKVIELEDASFAIRPRDPELAERLAKVVDDLLHDTRCMQVEPDGRQLIHVILQAGVLRAVDTKRLEAVLQLNRRVLFDLEAVLVRRQLEIASVSELTQAVNEYSLPGEVSRRTPDDAPAMDQRNAMPTEVLQWLEALPDDCIERLHLAYEAFQVVGAVTSTEAFRDWLAMRDLTVDFTFYATAAAHLMVEYAQGADQFFRAFMEDHFGGQEDSKYKPGPVKKVTRIIAKSREDMPTLVDESKVSEDARLRCAYCQVCDVIRCTLKADGAENMISLVHKVQSLGEMSRRGKFSVWRIKNTHHVSQDAGEIVGGYRDVKLLGLFTASAPFDNGLAVSMIAEVQVIDKVFFEVKTFMHRAYAIARGDYSAPSTSGTPATSRHLSMRSSMSLVHMPRYL
mmetsp:Transcript_116837/g.330563  ORF Transcript_116837/g.330563 Transcript_116837/m.330563 type:complete len:852 (-) Transcript_116837:147-2702(-)